MPPFHGGHMGSNPIGSTIIMKTTLLKKTKQLGLNPSTANNILKKNILFSLICETKRNICFQCGNIIKSIEELSIEHKIPWLDSENPKELYFDLNNIAFSHLACNVAAKRPRIIKHPSFLSYRNGCRCEGCKNENKSMVYKHRNKNNNSSK